ncbi:MAG: PA2778 family cysteine peptidase [Deferribacterales bacterium]
MPFRHLAFIALALFMAGCTAKTSVRWDRAVQDTPEIALSVPFQPQTEYNCGPASLAMVLQDKGVSVDQKDLIPIVYTPSKKGTLQPDMLQGARRYGKIPYTVTSPDELISQLTEDRPTVVFLNLGLKWHPVWHYAVVTGISRRNGMIYLHSGLTEDEPFTEATFDHVWGRAGYWGFVLLNPGEIPSGADPLRLMDSTAVFDSGTHKADALKTYEAAYEKWQSDKTVMFAYANSLYINGRKAESVAIFNKLTNEYPDAADAWNNLAQILSETGNKDEAVKAAEKAVELGGKNIDIYKQTLLEVK